MNRITGRSDHLAGRLLNGAGHGGWGLREAFPNARRAQNGRRRYLRQDFISPEAAPSAPALPGFALGYESRYSPG